MRTDTLFPDSTLFRSLGGSALASWTPFGCLIGVFAAITVALFVVGQPSPTPWPMLQPLARIPNGLTRITRIPGWAAVTIGTALYGLDRKSTRLNSSH